ncbi:hypothetical protein ACNOYE_00210 [Nannocystaceae bacterium ST9]
MAADDQDGAGTVQTLDDGEDRELTMAQLRARLEVRKQAAAEGRGLDPLAPTEAKPRPRSRDDELLDELPATEHMGGFSGWKAGRRVRWIIVGVFAAVGLTIAIVSWKLAAQREYERLHPLPEVEATIAPGTPREMTLADGQFRLGIAREAPAINVVHLPDRDITLAKGSDKAQFKVEVADGKTTRLVVLTGKIVETLHEGAEPLLKQ